MKVVVVDVSVVPEWEVVRIFSRTAMRFLFIIDKEKVHESSWGRRINYEETIGSNLA